MRTGEIFPYDMDTKYLQSVKDLQESLTDAYLPHTDRVLRPEIVSSFPKLVKSDLKKQIPGMIKRSDFVAVKDTHELDDMRDVLEISLKLRNVVLPKIIRDFDDMKTVALKSKQL